MAKEELLAERCEAATGPDRDLDGMIAGIVGTEFHSAETVRECAFDAHGWGCDESELPKWAGAAGNLGALKFTASLDAAMTLVPEGWGIVVGTYDLPKRAPFARLFPPDFANSPGR